MMECVVSSVAYAIQVIGVAWAVAYAIKGVFGYAGGK